MRAAEMRTAEMRTAEMRVSGLPRWVVPPLWLKKEFSVLL